MELTNERITHKKFGSGIITGVKDGEKGEVLDVRFDTGEQKQIGLWICIENGLIQLEDEEKQRELEALQKEREEKKRPDTMQKEREARKEEERKAEEPHKTKTEEKRKERDKAEATGEKKEQAIKT